MRASLAIGAAIVAGWCMSTASAALAGDGQGSVHSGQTTGGRASGPPPAGAAGPRSSDAVHRGAASPPAAPTHERRSGPRGGGAPRVGVNRGTTDLFLAGPHTYAPRFRSRLFFPYSSLGYGLPVYTADFSSAPEFEPGYGLGGAVSEWAAGGDYSPFAAVYSAMPPPQEPSAPQGNVRLDVEPVSAQVFVDGDYVGTVDDFWHSLAGLNLGAGPHRFEFRAAGYEPLIVDVKVEANRTITYSATLRRPRA